MRARLLLAYVLYVAGLAGSLLLLGGALLVPVRRQPWPELALGLAVLASLAVGAAVVTSVVLWLILPALMRAATDMKAAAQRYAIVVATAMLLGFLAALMATVVVLIESRRSWGMSLYVAAVAAQLLHLPGRRRLLRARQGGVAVRDPDDDRTDAQRSSRQ